MTMVATMQNQGPLEMQEIDPRLVVPLCIRENRLEGDYLLPPKFPLVITKATALVPGVLASPTSITEVIECLPDSGDNWKETDENGLTKRKDKKKKKLKGKIFRSKKRSAKDEAELAKQEVLRRTALRMQHIQQEEDDDFAKLRFEEGESPKLDTLVHYPLTLMEQVLSIPLPEPEETDDEDEEEEELGEEALQQQPVEPEVVQVLDLGRFEADVHKLRVSKLDLRRFVSHPTKFAQLQQELRDRRCITDETLRQNIHVFCQRENIDGSECHDIFSEHSDRRKGWSCNLPLAYRRMNKIPKEMIDWRKSVEDDPTMLSLSASSESTPDCPNGRKKRSDRKLFKGRESYNEAEIQDEAEGGDLLAYERENLQDGVDLLTYCVQDLIPLVEQQDVFTNLQLELRKIGAVTNEVLKQGLHFYVRDVRLQKERESAALHDELEEKNSADLPGDPSLANEGGRKRQPLLRKLRFRSRRKLTD